MRRSRRRRPTPGQPLDCHQVRDLMQAFVDGELEPEETRLVAEHVDRCRDCGVETATFLQVKEALAQLRTEPDADAVARLRATVDGLTSNGS